MGHAIDAIDEFRDSDVGMPLQNAKAEFEEVTEGLVVLDLEDEPEPELEHIDPVKKRRSEQSKLFKVLALEVVLKIQAEQKCRNEAKRANMKLDDGLTIEQLMQEQGRAALNDPREYQLELCERAKQENTIAVLETGSGKTLIAVLLIKWILDQEVEDRAKGLPPRTTFFMVPSNTLVYQQTAVLKCNMDHGVDSRCGDMNANDSLERLAWEKRLANNMVVVCTPEILHQCLRHSLVTMDKINLLVFDEAHHAKKKHPYAQIVADFYKPYRAEGHPRQPRIFGMTASPIDAKVDLVNASQELETTLDCKIATFPLAQEYRNNAQETTLPYNQLQEPFKTPLHLRLEEQLKYLDVFDRMFRNSMQLSSQLGRWAAEIYWAHVLSDDEHNKLAAKLNHNRRNKHRNVEIENQRLEKLKRARGIVQKWRFRNVLLDHADVSDKVMQLILCLQDHYDHDLKNRCIVFVTEKATARMLTEILYELRPKYLRPGLLTGHAAESGDARVTFKQQVLTMTKFRKDDINCLVATSVAEEGLDVPECNLVIRFDLYDTVIKYVQSKGRARHKNSKFIDMVERDNLTHVSIRNDARHQEHKLNYWIKNLKPDRYISGNDADVKVENIGRYFVHQRSQAKVTYWSSLGVLSLFASTLETEDPLATFEPTYIMSANGGGFVCEVVMPQMSPIRFARGLRYPRKALAKRSAAFEMCLELLKGRFLNRYLLSTFERKRPEGANAHLAVNEKKTGKYTMRLKPSAWSNGRGTVPEVVYLTIIDMPDGLERPHQPIGLVTRYPLPQFPKFPLFLTEDQLSFVHTYPMPSFEVAKEEVHLFTKYTWLLWLHVNAKKFEEDDAKMSYWVVPILKHGFNQQESRQAVDWEAISHVERNDCSQWAPGMETCKIVNKFIVDPWAGNRRFFSERLAPHLQPLSDIPEKTAKFDRPGAKKKKNILQYSVSLYAKAFDEAWPKWNKEQPVMECTQLMHRQNLLARPTAKEMEAKTKHRTAYLCPEPLIISPLSPETVTMFLVFPAIIHRIEDYLIALEAAQVVGIDISPALALEAMTKDSDNSDDHNADKPVNFRPGMGNNYERLEFMGDCFLKTATSISLFVTKPHDDEFRTHVARMHMICNENLMNTALNLNLTEYVRTQAFSRRLWYPEALKLLEGKGKNKVGGEEVIKHSLGEKSIADICEALIGGAFIQHNVHGSWHPQQWVDAIKAVTKLVSNEHHTMQTWQDYIDAYKPPAWQTQKSSAVQQDLAHKLEAEQGYRFNWPRLLLSAFSHPSVPFTWQQLPSYQRLEFLGDALLDLACITHLFYEYPDKNPQWLTEHKMAMVSNKFLGAVSVKIGFHRHMRHNDSKLRKAVMEYVDEVELAVAEAKPGEVDYWTHIKDPPKCLADIVESYIGALFIDSGFDYNRVQHFFNEHILPFFCDMTIYDSFASNHPVTRLHHTLAQIYGCQAYQLLCETLDPDVIGGKPQCMVGLIIHEHREIIGATVKESGRCAREAASKKALEELRGLTLKEFKNKFNCDCKVQEGVDMDRLVDIDEAAPMAARAKMEVDDENEEYEMEDMGLIGDA